MYQGVRYHLSLSRVAAQRAHPRLARRLATASLRWETLADPDLPQGTWIPLDMLMAGICGSDLALLLGRASPYLAPLTSFPAVLGHEIVGSVHASAAPWPRGTRVVVDPTLGCRARGLPLCRACQAGRDDGCERRADGQLGPGLLLGFHSRLPGGWATRLWAPLPQVHPVPDDVPTRRAVLAEPLAIVAAGLAPTAPARSILVLGAGTLGLLATWWLAEAGAGDITVSARYPHQQALARQLGATRVVAGAQLETVPGAGSALGRPLFGAPAYIAGGFDLVVDAVGSAETLQTALAWTRAEGEVVVLGALQRPALDMTPLWARKLTLRGSYGYRHQGVSVFPAVLERLREGRLLDALVTDTWPLHAYPQAVGRALAHRSGSVKVAFQGEPALVSGQVP
jgi:threonine dehydrogenase-like Zn-dependent dehydrogenase